MWPSSRIQKPCEGAARRRSNGSAVFKRPRHFVEPRVLEHGLPDPQPTAWFRSFHCTCLQHMGVYAPCKESEGEVNERKRNLKGAHLKGHPLLLSSPQPVSKSICQNHLDWLVFNQWPRVWRAGFLVEKRWSGPLLGRALVLEVLKTQRSQVERLHRPQREFTSRVGL